MTPTRKWVPKDYVDEVTPEPKAHPSDWLIPMTGGRFALAPNELETEEVQKKLRLLAEGERVSFEWVDEYGTIGFQIHEDMTWTFDPPPPRGAQHFYLMSDFDVFEGNPEDFALLMVGSEDCPGTHEVGCFTWCTAAVVYEFRGGTFTEIGEEVGPP